MGPSCNRVYTLETHDGFSIKCGVVLRNGVVLPSIGLGTYKATGEQLIDAVKCAYRTGIRHIDTALAYKNEEYVFEGLNVMTEALEDCFVTSKIGPRYHGHDGAHEGCEETLRKLNMDSIGLMLIHWPGVTGLSLTHPSLPKLRQETWRVLEELYNEGKFRAIGVSNYEASHLEELLSYAKVKPMVNQIEVHPRFPNLQVREFCNDNDIKVVAYGSLGRGDLVRHPVITTIAERLQKTPAQVLLKWALQQDMVVIPKSVNEERIKEWSPELFEGWQLTKEDFEQIQTVDDSHKDAWDPSIVS